MKQIITAFFITMSLGTLAAPKYSATAFQRPFTMPKNSFESSLSFSNKNVAELGFDYGLTDLIQMGIGWRGLDQNNQPTQALSINVAADLFSTPYASAMAKLSMPLYFQNQLIQEVSAGMPTYIPLVRGYLNLVLLENLATIKWTDQTVADFAFHARLSWQATQALCLNLSTTAGTLSTSGEHLHVMNTIPVKLSALYAITPMVDVIGDIGYQNLQTTNGASGMTMLLGLLFRGGAIEG